MKTIFTAILFFLAVTGGQAQTLDSIFFNLYTDSLKKGTYNYINIDGKFSNGRYLPLSSKHIKLSSSGGNFDGNSLFIDTSFREEKVTVKAEAIDNPALKKEIVIYIKKHDDNERLPTVEEIMNKPGGSPPNERKKSKRKG